jgi:nitroreductase
MHAKTEFKDEGAAVAPGYENTRSLASSPRGASNSPSPTSLKHFLARVKKFLKKRALKLAAKIDAACLPFAARSQFLAKNYYYFINSNFSREQHATAAGRYFHIKHEASSDIAAVILRRNIHRLEKGLSMIPRKDIFALDYIDETLYAFENLVRSGTEDDAALIKYTNDVLGSYFSVTKWAPGAAQPARFQAVEARLSGIVDCGYLAAPAAYEQLPRANIDYEQFLRLTQQRASVRNFLKRAVPPELVQKAVAAAAQAPSACNRQPFRYIAAADNPLKSALADLPMGTKGYAADIPVLLAVVGDLSAYPYERDRHIIYIDASLANMQLMLALETLGLASCSINWPDMEDRERKISKLLKLESHERVIMLIAVGFPDPHGLVPHSEKKVPAELLTYLR